MTDGGIPYHQAGISSLLVATAPSPADLPVVQSSKVELVIYQPGAGFYVNATQLPWSAFLGIYGETEIFVSK